MKKIVFVLMALVLMLSLCACGLFGKDSDEGSGDNTLNEAIRMAGTVICITPLVTIYFILQKYFVQSVDMVGFKE